MRRAVLGLVALGVLLAVGLCAAVLAVGLKLSSPAPATMGAAPPDLPGAEAVEIASASGSPVHGWWVPATASGAGPGGAVVLAHGVWANRREMVPRARMLHGRGFSVLLIDLHAHGETPGRRITFGKLEGLDEAAAVAFVRARVPAARIGLISVSLGGAAAVLGPEPLPVDALVLESVYPDIDAALANRLRAGLGRVAGPLFTPVLTPIFERLLPPILGVTPDELRPIDHVGSATAPILILSGTEDDRTPPDETRDCLIMPRSRSSSGWFPGPLTWIWSTTSPPVTGAMSCPSCRTISDAEGGRGAGAHAAPGFTSLQTARHPGCDGSTAL